MLQLVGPGVGEAVMRCVARLKIDHCCIGGCRTACVAKYSTIRLTWRHKSMKNTRDEYCRLRQCRLGLLSASEVPSPP